jgi:Protein of unknown function (DUF1538)
MVALHRKIRCNDLLLFLGFLRHVSRCRVTDCSFMCCLVFAANVRDETYIAPSAPRVSWPCVVFETFAEPALNALGISVEKVTNGNFPKAVVMYRHVCMIVQVCMRMLTCVCSVAFGVAFGISAGVLKILQGWNLTYMLLITYAIAIALTVTPPPHHHTAASSLPHPYMHL